MHKNEYVVISRKRARHFPPLHAIALSIASLSYFHNTTMLQIFLHENSSFGYTVVNQIQCMIQFNTRMKNLTTSPVAA